VAALLVVLTHLAFVVFVLAGGFLVWQWRRLLPFHLAAVATSAALAVAGLDCPLTDVEKGLLRLAGDEPYTGGFIAHYLVRPLYGGGMTPGLRIGLRVFTVAVVATAYLGLILLRGDRRGLVAPAGQPS
jgi:hypothetical protein